MKPIRPCACDRFLPGRAYTAGRDCRQCWMFAHRPAVRKAWGGDPGDCTPVAAAGPGAAPGPGHAPAGFVADPGRIRHLLYHVYPLDRDGGAVWRWNVAELKRRIDLFNGRRVIGVAVGPETEPASAVHEALARLGCEFVERPNAPALGEMTTFPTLLESLSGYTGPEHATFYGHTKGVSSSLRSPTVRRWAESMYETCLDYWPAVRRALRSHPLAGCWKRTNWGWPGQSRSTWHYSGTFRWSRNADLYGRNWREIDPFWSGSESHTSLHFDEREAAALAGEFSGDGMMLYTEPFWRRRARPALDLFRATHAGDRWTPLASPSFAVVCIAHNEELIIDAFLDHYIGHGASKILLIDNDSTDSTAGRARRRPAVEVTRLESGELDDAWRTATFQRLREECAGRYDWVILVDADELIAPKGGGLLREALSLYPLASALGTEGWDVIQGPGEPPMDWTRPPLAQRRWAVANEEYSKPVVLRPGGPERLDCGQHRFRTPEPHPPERPFRLFHIAAADEELFMRRRRQMAARQSTKNIGRGLGWQYTNLTEADIRRRWDAAVTNPRKAPLPCLGHAGA